MITNLDRADIDAYVEQPGVALLNWHSHREAMSVVFDAGFENVSVRHPDVHIRRRRGDQRPRAGRFLGGAWRARADGVSRWNARVCVRRSAAEMVLEALIDAIWALDMEQVRRGIDGQGTRLVLSMQPTGVSPFELEEGGGEGPGGTPGGKPVTN